jgi:DNA-binding GntR family transcriptional regulator
MQQHGGDGTRFQKPTTLAVEIARHLRDAIIRGKIRPGEHLNEAVITRDLASSRSPVREALRILEAEGLVTVQPHRGACVRPLSERELLDIFEVRVMFESQGLRSPRESDPRLLAEMEEAVDRAGTALAATDWETWHVESLRFHQGVVRLAGNAHLHGLYQELQNSLRRYQISLITLPDRPARSQHDHEAILDAIKREDRALALDLLVTHIRTLEEELLGAMRQAGAASPGPAPGHP